MLTQNEQIISNLHKELDNIANKMRNKIFTQYSDCPHLITKNNKELMAYMDKLDSLMDQLRDKLNEEISKTGYNKSLVNNELKFIAELKTIMLVLRDSLESNSQQLN